LYKDYFDTRELRIAFPEPQLAKACRAPDFFVLNPYEIILLDFSGNLCRLS
jgi:hypothetical protein